MPRWIIIKTYGTTFAGSIVWRRERASTRHDGEFLHASDTYGLLWQGLVANAAQLSPLGLGAGMPGARLELARPPRLIGVKGG